MALTLVKATGTLTDNSYADLTDATTYFESALPADETAWNALADDATRERYLVMAARILDDSFDWIGRRTTDGNGQDEGQRMEWPRRDVPRDGWSALDKLGPPYDLTSRLGRLGIAPGYRDTLALFNLDELESDELPIELIEANCQLAVMLTYSDRTADSQLTHLQSIASGDERIVWKTGNEAVPFSQGTIPSKVFDMIRKYGYYKPSLNSERSGGGVGRLSRA